MMTLGTLFLHGFVCWQTFVLTQAVWVWVFSCPLKKLQHWSWVVLLQCGILTDHCGWTLKRHRHANFCVFNFFETWCQAVRFERRESKGECAVNCVAGLEGPKWKTNVMTKEICFVLGSGLNKTGKHLQIKTNRLNTRSCNMRPQIGQFTWLTVGIS